MTDELILIVDDQPENISILYDFLESMTSHRVLVASNGEDALEIAQTEVPDLILLDVMMPGLNGFDVCKELKANPKTTEIPIIFITALADTENKLKGFEAGGADYLTKPFQHKEVYARVSTHLALAGQRRELTRNNEALRAANDALQIHNAELEAFAHTVAHDLKNPLGNMMANASFLAMLAAENNNTEMQEIARGLEKSSMKAADIVESLLLLAGTSRHMRVHYEAFSMDFVVKRTLNRLQTELQQYACQIQQPQAAWPFVSGFAPWTEEIWTNYISNALKYGGTPPQVELGFNEIEDGFVRFWVRDNGPGLTPEQQAQLFVPFTRLHTNRADGHGLGLTIVQRIVDKLGGKVGIESQAGAGSLFYFTLPYRHQTAKEE